MTVLRARWAGKTILFQINIEDEGFNLVGTLRSYDGNGKGNVKKQ